MTTIRKTILIGITALGLAASAVGASAAAVTGEAGTRHGQWAERAQARQQQLHDTLKLTPSQERAWSAYASATRHPARERDGHHGGRAQWQALSAPQRLERRIAMARQHTERMEARLAAMSSLYAVLTPEQQALFDESGRGEGHHGRRGGHHSRG